MVVILAGDVSHLSINADQNRASKNRHPVQLGFGNSHFVKNWRDVVQLFQSKIL